MSKEWALLDDRALEGTIGVQRYFGPSRRVVVVSDTAAAFAAIESRCQLWGGAAHILIPADSTQRCPVEGPWADLSAESDPDAIEGFGATGELPETAHPREWPVPLAPVISSMGRARDNFLPLGVPVLSAADPWRVAYLGAVGSLPVAPSDFELSQFGFRSDFRYDELLPVAREEIVGSATDLLDRVQEGASVTPVRLSLADLQPFAAERARPFGETFDETMVALPKLGPDFVVVYEPDSVVDLCLLWCLRASAAFRHGFPLAVPVTENVVDVVREWERAAAAAPRAVITHPCRGLVSATVSKSTLERLADELGEKWAVVEVDDVLRAAPPPSRASTEVAVFEGGRAAVATWSTLDTQRFGQGFRQTWGLRSRLRPLKRQLPPYRALAPRSALADRYRGGCFESRAGDSGTIVDMSWPNGWTVVQAFARDQGLQVRESAAGKAAAALARRMESLSSVSLLAHPEILPLLYRLAERAGMTWFRSRMNALLGSLKATEDDRREIARIEAHLNQLAASSDDAETRTITFAEARRVIGTREQTQHWLDWAEKTGVLVRGVTIACPLCGAMAWRTFGDLPPPLVCSGCAREIVQPFNAEQLVFRYRTSEPMLRACAHDALGHLLVLQWMTELLESGLHEPAHLYGGHPGVSFIDSAGREIGEADVLLLFRDGTSAIGEYKRSGAGLSPNELDKLDRLADATGASWTFVATHEMSINCPSIWRDCQRVRPDRARIALSGDRLFGHGFGPDSLDSLRWPEIEENATRQALAGRSSAGATAEWIARAAHPDHRLRDGWAYEDHRTGDQERS